MNTNIGKTKSFIELIENVCLFYTHNFRLKCSGFYSALSACISFAILCASGFWDLERGGKCITAEIAEECTQKSAELFSRQFPSYQIHFLI
jgi:hypothetical protein